MPSSLPKSVSEPTASTTFRTGLHDERGARDVVPGGHTQGARASDALLTRVTRAISRPHGALAWRSASTERPARSSSWSAASA
jgi:hypothetical protein